MKRAVESTEDFKARIAAIIGDETERITGARRPHPLLVRKKRVTTTQNSVGGEESRIANKRTL